jgi:hypothetical protein
MLASLVLMAGMFTGDAPAKSSDPFYRPYDRADLDLIYNLLFCDNPDLLRPKTGAPDGDLAVLLSKPPQLAALEKLAADETGESRVRAVAYLRLRGAKAKVPKGQLLGVIVEVPVDGGLDVLAVFADGRMRYLNHSKKIAVFEDTPAAMAATQQKLLAAAAAAIQRIGPWDKPRRPPPKPGNVRLSFLVSDGLYFGEGPLGAISKDQIGGPVLNTATQLLLAIVDASAKTP